MTIIIIRMVSIFFSTFLEIENHVLDGPTNLLSNTGRLKAIILLKFFQSNGVVVVETEGVG
jgi:hypothetical protein